MIAGGKFRTKGHLAQLDMLSILKNQMAYSDQQLVNVRGGSRSPSSKRSQTAPSSSAAQRSSNSHAGGPKGVCRWAYIITPKEYTSEATETCPRASDRVGPKRVGSLGVVGIARD